MNAVPQTSEFAAANAPDAAPPLVWVLGAGLQDDDGAAEPDGWRLEHFTEGARFLDALRAGPAPDLVVLDMDEQPNGSIDAIVGMTHANSPSKLILLYARDLACASIGKILADTGRLQVIGFRAKPLTYNGLWDYLNKTLEAEARAN